MTIQTFAFDGVNIEDLGLTAVSLTGVHDVPIRTYGLVQPALAYGQRALSIGSTSDLRAIAFRLNVPATSFTQRQALIDAIMARFGAQVMVSHVDAPTRQTPALLKSAVESTPGKRFVNPTAVVDFTLTGPDPLWYDVNPTLVNVPAATTMPLLLGTGPTRRLYITVQGTTTNPIVVILYDQTQTEIMRMTLTAPSSNLGASNWALIDCDDFQLLKNDNTDLFQAGWLGATESWFLLSPPPGPAGQPYYYISCAQTQLQLAYVKSWVA